MTIGTKIANARKRQGYTQEEFVSDLPVSRESLAKYETGDRKFPFDLRKMVAERLDDEEFYFTAWNESAGEVSIPYFDGDHVDHHPASLKHLVQSETNEALEQLERACWFKPIHSSSETEKQEMKRVIHELLDAAASMINLVAVICREYDFSMKDIFKEWRMTLKIRRLRK
nr:helix-turn-helix transcriptional regulator [Fredinandcohnia onubensis]